MGRQATRRARGRPRSDQDDPSGRILQPAELAGLAGVLEAASLRNQRAIYLLSDEAYSRILFDGEPFHTPLLHYSRSLLLYTYGKTLLTPGQRMGYIAMPPTMPDREQLRDAIFVAQLVMSYSFPNTVMQYAVGDLEKLTIDVGAIAAPPAIGSFRSFVTWAMRRSTRRQRFTFSCVRRSKTMSPSPSSWPKNASSSCRAESSNCKGGSASR
jgi:hypothetical protein